MTNETNSRTSRVGTVHFTASVILHSTVRLFCNFSEFISSNDLEHGALIRSPAVIVNWRNEILLRFKRCEFSIVLRFTVLQR